MTLALRSILERGNLAKERITFRVTDNIDVGDFALLQCSTIEEVLTTTVYKAFWFQYAEVSSGDLVVLYTKAGDIRSKDLGGGRKAHFFYWGLSSPIWHEDEVAAVVLRAPQWESKSVTELTGKTA